MSLKKQGARAASGAPPFRLLKLEGAFFFRCVDRHVCGDVRVDQALVGQETAVLRGHEGIRLLVLRQLFGVLHDLRRALRSAGVAGNALSGKRRDFGKLAVNKRGGRTK